MSTTPTRTSRTGIVYEPASRTCPTCGATFWPSPYVRAQRFCKQACRIAANNANRRGSSGIVHVPNERRACKHCGQLFKPIGNRRYCSKRCSGADSSSYRPPVQQHQALSLKPRAKPTAEQRAAIIPGTETRHIKGTFTAEAFGDALLVEQAKLKAAGRPLYRPGSRLEAVEIERRRILSTQQRDTAEGD